MREYLLLLDSLSRAVRSHAEPIVGLVESQDVCERASDAQVLCEIWLEKSDMGNLSHTGYILDVGLEDGHAAGRNGCSAASCVQAAHDSDKSQPRTPAKVFFTLEHTVAAHQIYLLPLLSCRVNGLNHVFHSIAPDI